MVIFSLVVNQFRYAILRILQFFCKRTTNIIIQRITIAKLFKISEVTKMVTSFLVGRYFIRAILSIDANADETHFFNLLF